MEDAPANGRELARSWQAVLGRLELELNPHNFATWLRGTRVLRRDGDVLTVEATSAMGCDWLSQRLAVVVTRAAAQVLGDTVCVRFVAPGTAAVPSVSAPVPEANATPAAVGQVVGQVNRSLTFEEYHAANGNQAALDQCLALLGPPEGRVSPVVLHGPPGMGKTHLLHAVAVRAAEQGDRVVCLTAEEFANRFISALRDQQSGAFQAAVRGANCLIIDDLQQISGKKGTQDELAHTVDAVRNAGGRVLVASERHPLELGLPDRLASRLVAGIVLEVGPFRTAERRSFVERVARRQRASLPGWAVDRLAHSHPGSVRLLLGAVHTAISLERYNRLDEAHLDRELARAAIAASAGEGADVARLIERIAQRFAVTPEDVTGTKRTAAVAEARAAAVAALQARGKSLRQLSVVFGGRDPSTIRGLAERGRSVLAAHPELQAAAGE